MKLVDEARKAQIIEDCQRKDHFFVCHKASFKDSKLSVCCRGFFETQDTLPIKIAKRVYPERIQFLSEADLRKIPRKYTKKPRTKVVKKVGEP